MANPQQQEQEQQDKALASEVLLLTATSGSSASIQPSHTTSGLKVDDDAAASKSSKKKTKKKKTKSKTNKKKANKKSKIPENEESAAVDQELGYGGHESLLNRDFKGDATNSNVRTTSNIYHAHVGPASANEPDPMQQPGAFRVFINGRPRHDDDDSSLESSFPSMPLADVTPVSDPHHTAEEFQQEEEEESPQTQSKGVEKKQPREDHFWIVVAAVFGILIVAAVIATVVLLRSRSKNDNGNQQDTGPTPAPVASTSFDIQYPLELDDYPNLHLYGVQFGFNILDCESTVSSTPVPIVEVSCQENSTIAILAVNTINDFGSTVDDRDKLTCETTAKSSVRCSSSQNKLPPITWFVGLVACANSLPYAGLEVLANFNENDCTAASTDTTIHTSHSVSTGLYCASSPSSSINRFNIDLECAQGVNSTVGETLQGGVDIPFCGQLGSCSNSDSDQPCSISNLESLGAKTSITPQTDCVMTKDVFDSSFQDRLDGTALWSELTVAFLVEAFATKAHEALISTTMP